MIHSNYANKRGAERYIEENRKELAKLKGKYRFVERGEDYMDVIADNTDKAVIRRLLPTTGQLHFRVVWNAPKLTDEQLALICDRGDLRHGYSTGGDYINVFTF